jgi:flagellar biosynthetic protein FliR
MSLWLSWWVMLILASVRIAVAIAMTPLLTAFNVPAVARVIIVVALAALATSQATAPIALTAPAIARALCIEFTAGLLIAIGVHVAFASMTAAGRIMDVQMGFSLGAILDPVSKGHSAVTATTMNLLGVVIFFTSDAHQLFLAGFFHTFHALPSGEAIDLEQWLPLAEHAGAMFSIGLALASPVVAALLLTDVVVGVVSRNLPQMNVLFLSIPIKILLGLLVMSVSIRFMGPVIMQALTLPLTLLEQAR